MYFDYAATTPVLNEIKNNAHELLTRFENPSSLHVNSKVIKDEIEQTRNIVAKLINAKPHQIFFTSGATESNNTVIKGFYNKNREVKHHYFTSLIEHPSILEPIDYLNSNSNFSFEYIKTEHLLSPNLLKQHIANSSPSFASFMLANNETGTLFPIKEIGELLKENNTYFHVDATQAIGKIRVDVEELNIDALSFSGHKIFAPKGIGVLYLKDTDSIEPLIHGGGQEKGFRCGTENVFAILSLKIALEYFDKNLTAIEAHYNKCRLYFLSKLNEYNIDYTLNEDKGLPNIISIRFSIKGDALADVLNFKYNTMISVGSACSSNKNEKKLSHVLKNIGLQDHDVQKTTRISFGPNTTLENINELVKNINNVLTVFA